MQAVQEQQPLPGQGQGYGPEDPYGGMPPPLGDPSAGARLVTHDSSFMKWLFSFRKEVIIPLRRTWMGYEFNTVTEKWKKPEGQLYPLMNEEGITWGISLIESYLSPVYIVSNYDEKAMNYTMREVVKVIWNNICLRWKTFAMKKSDIPRVCNEIESKIHAILLGARGDGYRTFLTKQYHITESFNTTDNPIPKKKIFGNIFGRHA